MAGCPEHGTAQTQTSSRASVPPSPGQGRDPEYAFLALLGVEAGEFPAVARHIERGLPYRSLEEFQRHAALSVAEVAELISLPARTLARRRGGRLRSEESDRLVRAARVFAQAVGLFEGDEEAARAWLSTPQLAFGGVTPYAAARTDPGAREVEQLIGRLVKASLAAQAFTGEGARLYGARWSSPGVTVVYLSESLALAALEILVHLQSRDVLASYVAFRLQMNGRRLARAIDPARLPLDWRAWPAPPGLRTIGDEWARRTRSLILEVPSAVVPQERNYRVNPAHPEFRSLIISAPQPFTFDTRL